jgi:hypothetical protein
VPFAAGGLNDTIGRIVTDRMRMSLGQPVIIENVAGANIARLNAAVVDALADPALRARPADLGQMISGRAEQTPEALGRLSPDRDREVVTDDQGRRHQGGLTTRAVWA